MRSCALCTVGLVLGGDVAAGRGDTGSGLEDRAEKVTVRCHPRLAVSNCPELGPSRAGRPALNGGVHERSPKEEAMSRPQRLRDVLAEDPLLMTPEEAARLLRVGRTTVYALMKAGDLHPVHIGRSCRLARAELERYVRGLEAPRTAPLLVRCAGPGRPRTSADSPTSARPRPMPRESTTAPPVPDRSARLTL